MHRIFAVEDRVSPWGGLRDLENASIASSSEEYVERAFSNPVTSKTCRTNGDRLDSLRSPPADRASPKLRTRAPDAELCTNPLPRIGERSS